MASASPSSASASTLAEAAIQDLTARFPGRVQIHLHPSTSLPSAITTTFSPTSTADDPDPCTTTGAPLPVALVWTVSSLKLLRSYGLTGSFTGTLAQFPQQNIFLGLPIQLLPEEVVYLLRHDQAVVVEESASYRTATQDEVEGVQGLVEEDRRSQQLEAWHERQELRAKHAKTPTSSTTTPTSAPPPTEKELEVLPWHYTIPSTSSPLPWYTPTTYTTLSSLQHVFPFPCTEREVAQVGLFEHFVREGMWCMNGLRFGGALAVYPGDPLRYHSHYTAQLLLQHENVPLTQLVANGRLGTAVKKTHLLCHVRRLQEDVKRELEKEEGEGEGKVLKCVKEGTFDQAPKEGKGVRWADFDVFSLAWAGFGT